MEQTNNVIASFVTVYHEDVREKCQSIYVKSVLYGFHCWIDQIDQRHILQ